MVDFYNLTKRQKEFLREIVQAVDERRIDVPFGLIGNANVLPARGEEIRYNPGDLEALCDAGLLRSHLNSRGTGRLYTPTEAGIQAATSGFELPATEAETVTNIGAIIGDMRGGTVQAIGDATGHVSQSPANLVESQVLEERVSTAMVAARLISFAAIVIAVVLGAIALVGWYLTDPGFEPIYAAVLALLSLFVAVFGRLQTRSR